MLSRSLLVLAAIAVAPSSQPVALTKPAPVRRGIDAFPRIAAPANDQQRKINRALESLDQKVRSAARECVADSRMRVGDWGRQVDTPMRGPAFVSYVVTDDVDCGGAHPNTGHSAIVYDLDSGGPVDWTRLLPARLTGRLALSTGEDGVKVVTLASRRLFALYQAGYDHGASGVEEKECRDAIAAEGENGPVPMLAWLDAEGGGLALQFDLPHVEEACSEPVVLSIAVLRQEGASSRLLTALAAAHARGRPTRRR